MRLASRHGFHTPMPFVSVRMGSPQTALSQVVADHSARPNQNVTQGFQSRFAATATPFSRLSVQPTSKAAPGIPALDDTPIELSSTD